MSNFDEVKGRAKQAAGDLTDDQDLKDEGRVDEAGGKIKKAADKAEDKAEDAVDAMKDRFKK